MSRSGRIVPTFRATIALLGINPYVSVPAPHLKTLFAAAGRETSPIPIRVEIEGIAFRQNLVRYQGAWRLYLNTPMRKAAGKDVGERVTLSVDHDPTTRREPMPAALDEHPAARAAFNALPPSRKKEIQRYLGSAKTTTTQTRNISKVIGHLRGEQPPGLAVLKPRARPKSTSR
jgi:hypothetical protein